MTKTKTVEMKGIGIVLFEKSARAKYLNISVKPFTGVRVAVPRRMSFKMAEQTVDTKISWLQKHIPKKAQMERKNKGQEKKKKKKKAKIEEPIDHKEAGKLLVARLGELSRQHGLPYNRVSIRNQRTRWGSCSSKNNINLNIKLFLLPAELRDYVILHELIHTKIKSHGSEFYVELGRLVGKARVLKASLNSYKGVLSVNNPHARSGLNEA